MNKILEDEQKDEDLKDSRKLKIKEVNINEVFIYQQIIFKFDLIKIFYQKIDFERFVNIEIKLNDFNDRGFQINKYFDENFWEWKTNS